MILRTTNTDQPISIEKLHWRAKEEKLPTLATISEADLPGADRLATTIEHLSKRIVSLGCESPIQPIPPEKVFLELVGNDEGGFFGTPLTKGYDFRSASMHMATNPEVGFETILDQLIQSWAHDSIHVSTNRHFFRAPNGAVLWRHAGFVDRSYDWGSETPGFDAIHLSPEGKDPDQEVGRPYLGRLNEFFTEVHKAKLLKRLGVKAMSDSLDGRMLHLDETLAIEERCAGFWKAFMTTGYGFLNYWEKRGAAQEQVTDAFVFAMLTGDRSRIERQLAPIIGNMSFENLFMSRRWAERHELPVTTIASPYAHPMP